MTENERVESTWRTEIKFTTVAGHTITDTRELAYPLDSDRAIRKLAEHIAEAYCAVALDVVEFRCSSWPGKPSDRPGAPTPPPERAELWRQRGYAGPDVSPLPMPRAALEWRNPETGERVSGPADVDPEFGAFLEEANRAIATRTECPDCAQARANYDSKGCTNHYPTNVAPFWLDVSGAPHDCPTKGLCGECQGLESGTCENCAGAGLCQCC